MAIYTTSCDASKQCTCNLGPHKQEKYTEFFFCDVNLPIVAFHFLLVKRNIVNDLKHNSCIVIVTVSLVCRIAGMMNN